MKNTTELDAKTDYILVQTPHRGAVFTCVGTPAELTAILTANGRTHINYYAKDEDWSSYGDGEQPDWFKGEGWYYEHAHSDAPEGPVDCEQAILEIAGHDHNDAVLLTKEQAIQSVLRHDTRGHMGVERFFALQEIVDSFR